MTRGFDVILANGSPMPRSTAGRRGASQQTTPLTKLLVMIRSAPP